MRTNATNNRNENESRVLAAIKAGNHDTAEIIEAAGMELEYSEFCEAIANLQISGEVESRENGYYINIKERTETNENGVTIHYNQTADRIEEKAQAIAESVAVVFGSSLPVSDMVTSCQEFREWISSGNPAPFFLAVRKQGTESGSREEVRSRCEALGRPLYIIKVERNACELFTLKVKAVTPAPAKGDGKAAPVVEVCEPTQETTTEETTAPTVAAVAADYAAGTLDSIKNRSRKAWAKVAKVAGLVARRVVGVLLLVVCLASTLGVLWSLAVLGGDLLEGWNGWARLVWVLPMFGGCFAYELLYIKALRFANKYIKVLPEF